MGLWLMVGFGFAAGLMDGFRFYGFVGRGLWWLGFVGMGLPAWICGGLVVALCSVWWICRYGGCRWWLCAVCGGLRCEFAGMVVVGLRWTHFNCISLTQSQKTP